jgi:hypothetical protein
VTKTRFQNVFFECNWLYRYGSHGPKMTGDDMADMDMDMADMDMDMADMDMDGPSVSVDVDVEDGVDVDVDVEDGPSVSAEAADDVDEEVDEDEDVADDEDEDGRGSCHVFTMVHFFTASSQLF